MIRNGHSIVFKTTVSLFSVLLFVFGFSFASADEVNQTSATQTLVPTIVTQTLIPGAVSCDTPVVSSLKPYIYGGFLHSFDFTVSDASQVALAGSVGNQSVLFNYIQRTAGENGSVKMHVDISSEHVGAGLPISITMLSAKGAGQPVCVTTLSLTLRGSDPVADGTAPSISAKEEDDVIKPPGWGNKTISNIFSSIMRSSGEDVKKADEESVKESVTEEKVAEVGAGQDEEKTSWRAGLAWSGRDSILQRTGIVAAARDGAVEACTTENGASRTWMLLLAAYAVGALLLHSRRDRLFKDQMLQNAALALPLLVLAAFWYFVPECREGWWTLAGSVVIALVAIFGTSLWKKTPGDKKQNPWTAFHP